MRHEQLSKKFKVIKKFWFSVVSHINGLQLSVIVALDPAGPLFYWLHFEEKLRETDATLTPGIGSNVGYAALGFNGQLCRIEMLLNVGQVQPGCGRIFNRTCSHSRAYWVYAELLEKNYIEGQRTNSFEEAKVVRESGNTRDCNFLLWDLVFF